MIQYKLIKKYPASPELEYITQFNKDLEDWNTPNMTLLDDCQDNPEFWEEIKEKEFEILKIITQGGNILNSPYIDVNNLLEKQECKIYSIKRISDGKVFTIGDNVVFNKIHKFFIEKFYMDCNNNHLLCSNNFGTGHVNITKINKVEIPFYITEDGVEVCESTYVYWTCKLSGSNFYTYLYSLDIYKEHLKGSLTIIGNYKIFSTEEAAKDFCLKSKPLFISEDGVNIFEGDTIYGIDVYWKVFSHYTDLENKIKNWGIKPIFSIKEKAEEYILMNKPCLSIKEIINLGFEPKELRCIVENTLKKLVKTKI